MSMIGPIPQELALQTQFSEQCQEEICQALRDALDPINAPDVTLSELYELRCWWLQFAVFTKLPFFSEKNQTEYITGMNRIHFVIQEKEKEKELNDTKALNNWVERKKRERNEAHEIWRNS